MSQLHSYSVCLTFLFCYSCYLQNIFLCLYILIVTFHSWVPRTKKSNTFCWEPIASTVSLICLELVRIWPCIHASPTAKKSASLSSLVSVHSTSFSHSLIYPISDVGRELWIRLCDLITLVSTWYHLRQMDFRLFIHVWYFSTSLPQLNPSVHLTLSEKTCHVRQFSDTRTYCHILECSVTHHSDRCTPASGISPIGFIMWWRLQWLKSWILMQHLALAWKFSKMKTNVNCL